VVCGCSSTGADHQHCLLVRLFLQGVEFDSSVPPLLLSRPITKGVGTNHSPFRSNCFLEQAYQLFTHLCAHLSRQRRVVHFCKQPAHYQVQGASRACISPLFDQPTSLINPYSVSSLLLVLCLVFQGFVQFNQLFFLSVGGFHFLVGGFHFSVGSFPFWLLVLFWLSVVW
jgi:hypothetical protein